MKSVREVPSLKVWLWVLGIFLIWEVFAFTFYKWKLKDKILYFVEPQLERIRSDFSNPKNQEEDVITVVAIGSSLFLHGIQDLEVAAEYAKQKHKRSIRLHKIVQSGDPYKTFVMKHHILEELVKLEPDIICIQTELVAIQIGSGKAQLEPILPADDPSLRKENPLFIKALIASNVNQNVATHFIDKYFEKDGIASLETRDTLNYKASQRIVKKVKDVDFAFSAYKKLKSANIKTIIVDIPRPSAIEKEVYTDVFVSELQDFLEMYQKNFDIAHWAYSGDRMFYKHFFDYGHLNNEGKKIYTEWLIDKIIKEQ